MKTETFTSTISPQLNQWLAEYAKATSRTRRAVLEDALQTYRRQQIKDQMKADFVRAATDPDTLEMTEWGMDDYQKLTNEK
jgi:predicted transcriptional regulator